ncbi:MAG TPA: RNA 2',3'-cyclic phosphodiesterase [Gemmatimonadales bacterium]|jgi:2'-5' RNA ligase
MRLFVAINLPDAVRRRVWDATASLRSAALPVRWGQPEGLHVTLKFLGEVAADRERELTDAVRACVAGVRPFSVGIAGCGAVPTAARPRVVWIGCEASPPLELLQDRVERAMNALGYPNEGRVFRPHLTLGRARRDARSPAFAGFDALAAEVIVDEVFTVTSVDLMRSVLGRAGARYERLFAAELETF